MFLVVVAFFAGYFVCGGLSVLIGLLAEFFSSKEEG